MKLIMTACAKTYRRIRRAGWGIAFLLATVSLLLTSCLHETDSTPHGTLGVAKVSMGAETVITTRGEVTDNITGSGYVPVDPEMEIREIKIYTFGFLGNERKSEEDKSGGSFRYRVLRHDDTLDEDVWGWTSNVDASDGYNYNLFAFSVDEQLCPNPSLRTQSDNGVNAKLTLNGVKVITEIDPLVSVAAAGGDGSGLSTDFTEGAYNIGEVKIKTASTENEKTRVWLAMKHLLAKASVQFKIDGDYDKIRTIKIKSASVSTAGGGALSSSMTYSYGTSDDTQGSLEYTIDAGSNNETIALLDAVNNPEVFDVDSETGDPLDVVTLTTSSKLFKSFCFLPKQRPSITLTVTYDVYDKAGNLIRANQTVTNSNLLSKVPVDANAGLAGGNNYIITVSVNPTYLYQLSDGDAPLELIIE